MVNCFSAPPLRCLVQAAAAVGFLSCLLSLAGCRQIEPIRVDGEFVTSPRFVTASPSIVSLLPIEDGTEDGAAARHVTMMRQEINRQLPERLYSPTRQQWVDASLRGAAPIGESIMAPGRLAEFARAGKDDAVLAVRVGKWDESTLMSDHRVRFAFDAAMVGKDGTQLWSGHIEGSVKAGGVGAAPLGREASARSCIELAVRQLMLRLPDRIVD